MHARAGKYFLAFILGVFLIGAWLGPTSRPSAAAPWPRPVEQTEVDLEDVFNRLNGWFGSAFGGNCFNGLVRLGDISKVRERFNAGDVQVYVDPAFLEEEGAAAAYVDYSMAGLEYFNDLVLADVPAKVPVQTLWHEAMHAILDDHDSELSDLGVTTDERYTWYMELTVNALSNTLEQYERELKKGEDCDPEKLERRWNLFEEQMKDARNTNGFGYITDEQLRQLEQLTGFHANLDELRQYYKSDACGVCGPTTPTPPVVTSGELDLIFCIDVTGSMDDDIASVKAAASNIVNTIAAKNKDFRVAIVAYRDWDDSEGYAMFEDYAFSSDKDAIISNINRLSVGGGDDEPEAVLEALMRAIDSKAVGGWRNNVNKQVIVMGDAPPHDPSRQGYTAASVAQAAWDADPVVIQAIVVGNDGYYSPAAVEAFRELADLTDGSFFEAENADAVPEVLQKTIEVIETATADTFKVDSKLLLMGGAVLCGLAIFGLLFLVLLVRFSRRRRAPQPVPQAPLAVPQPVAPPPPAPAPGRSRGREKTVVATPLTVMELIVMAGAGSGTRFPLHPSNRIGRAEDNEIVLRDSQVSRHHAVITSSGAQWFITDLGSANGTWVNGVRIAQPTKLSAGDAIQVGAERLVLHQEQ